MKTATTTILLVLSLSITGCANFVKTATCTESERAAIVTENNNLEEQKLVIEGYAAGGVMPGEKSTYSMLTRDDLLGVYMNNYNRYVDANAKRSATFNSLCVKK